MRVIKDDTTRRTAARNAYRAKIESLLDESGDDRLADVWQRVCPFPIDPAFDLPDRRGIIADLADFARVLQPGLDGMNAHRLCRLIEKYAAYGSRQSDLSVSLRSTGGNPEMPDPKEKVAADRSPPCTGNAPLPSTVCV